MNTFSKHFLQILIFILISLMGVSSLNYLIDPANIYHQIQPNSNNSVESFAKRLVESTQGLLWPNDSWNERDIKLELAKNQSITPDCIVLGSSRSMLIGQSRDKHFFNEDCTGLLNLSVSGGTLEDYVALSNSIRKRVTKPKVIIFNIDPWSFDFARDSRWERYQNEYSEMRLLLDKSETNLKEIIAEDENAMSTTKYLTNLINPYYFARSVEKVIQQEHIITDAPEFDFSKGISSPVFLPDGSLVYSSKHVAKSKNRSIPIGGKHYKIISQQQSDLKAIELFAKLVEYFKQRDIKIKFLLTPYHENIWKDKNSVTTVALIEMESIVKKHAQELTLQVLGSYDPKSVKCNPDEFYDGMHATVSCLLKITNDL